MNVTLEVHEVSLAARVGVERRLASIGRCRDQHGFEGENPWELDIQAAGAELAVAKLYGRYWDGSVNTWKRGDVGAVQVRSTPRSGGSLIIRPNDSDDDVFFLVTGEIPTFRVQGWIRGRDAKVAEYERAPNGRPPAWFVPQSALREAKP